MFWTRCCIPKEECAPPHWTFHFRESGNIDFEVTYIVSKHSVWRGENFNTLGAASLLTTHPDKRTRGQWVILRLRVKAWVLWKCLSVAVVECETQGTRWQARVEGKSISVVVWMAQVTGTSTRTTLKKAPMCTWLLVEVGLLNQQQGRQMVYLDSSDVLVRLR